MDAKELLPLLFERVSAFENLWNFDIAVTFGILAILAGMPAFRKTKWKWRWAFSAILFAAFAVFAWSNLDALLWTLRQRFVLEDAAMSALRELPPDTLPPDLTQQIRQLAQPWCGLPVAPLGIQWHIAIWDGCIKASGKPFPRVAQDLTLFYFAFSIPTAFAIFIVPFVRQKG